MANNTPRASDLTNVSDFVRSQLQRAEAQLASNMGSQPRQPQIPQTQRNVAGAEQKALPKPNRRSGVSREKPSRRGLSAEDLAKLPESVRDNIRDQLREQSVALSPSLRKILNFVKEGEGDKKKMRAEMANRSYEAAEYASSNNVKLNSIVGEQKNTVGLLRQLLITVKNSRSADREDSKNQRNFMMRALSYVVRRSISAAPAAIGFGALILAGEQRQAEETARRVDINTPDIPLPPPPPPPPTAEDDIPLPPPPPPPPPEEQTTQQPGQPSPNAELLDDSGNSVSAVSNNRPVERAAQQTPSPARPTAVPMEVLQESMYSDRAMAAAMTPASQATRFMAPRQAEEPREQPAGRESMFSRWRRLSFGPLETRSTYRDYMMRQQTPTAREPVTPTPPTPRPLSQLPMASASPASFSTTSDQRDGVTPNFMNRVMTLRAREIRFKAEEFKFEQSSTSVATPTGGSPIINASFQTPAPMTPGGGGTGQRTPQGGGALGSPLAVMTPTSNFRAPNRNNHEGIDLAAPIGTPVYATHDGTVTRADSSRSYGLVVYIQGDDGVETRYAHLSQIMVARGARVVRGQVIGLTGNSGRVMGPTGAHLHYEVRRNGQPVDPATTIPSLRGPDRQADAEPATPVDREQPGQQASPPAAAMQQPAVQSGQILEQNSRSEMIQNISMPVVTQPQENAQVDPADNPSVGIQTGGRWNQNTPGVVEPPDSRELYRDLFTIAI